MKPRALIEFLRGRMRLNFGSHRAEWGQIYIEPRDWRVGVFLGEHAVFVCLLPCVVLKVWRRS